MVLHPVPKWFFMFFVLRKHIAANGLFPGWTRFPAGCAAVFAGLLTASPMGVSAPVNPMPAEARLDFMSTDDGLTRDSIAAISRPENTHPADASAKGAAKSTDGTAESESKGEPGSTPKVTRRRHRLLVAATNRRHRRWARHHIARHQEDATPPPPSPQPRPRRNFVVRFVTWWNGMVVRNLHTRVGTVKLDSWGADS